MAVYMNDYAGKKTEAGKGCGYYFMYNHRESGEK